MQLHDNKRPQRKTFGGVRNLMTTCLQKQELTVKFYKNLQARNEYFALVGARYSEKIRLTGFSHGKKTFGTFHRKKF